MERGLGEGLVEDARLRQAWPKGKRIMARYEIGKKIGATLAGGRSSAG